MTGVQTCALPILITRLSDALKVELPRESTLQLKLQLLGNALDEISYPFHPDEKDAKSQARTKMKADLSSLQPLWMRLKNFQAVHDGYVAENPTPERFVDVLARLEFETFGRVKIRGRRKANVSVAEFINLRDHFAEYRENKRETVARLTDKLLQTVAEMLGIG